MSLPQFLRENKLYWIVPILLVLVLVAFIAWNELGAEEPPASDDASPFQYDLY